MGATFPRVKDFGDEILTQADLDAEFNNILNNFTPAGMDDYSASVAQMKLQTSPGSPATESLAVSFAGEIERIRFVLAQIKGTPFWYSPINNSLDTINDALETALAPNRIESGKMRADSSQPIFLRPNGAALTVAVMGATTPLVAVIDDAVINVTTDLVSSALVAAPAANNTALVNDAGVDDSEHTKFLGEFRTSLIIDAAGTEITNRVSQLAGFKINNGVTNEYFIARIKSSTELTEVRRGFFFDSADAPLPRLAIADNDVITFLKLAYIFLKTDGTLTASYDEPIYSGTEPTSPASGQYWFDTANTTWKRFDGAAFVAADAILIGHALSTSAATVAARSLDFAKSFSDDNTLSIEKFDNAQVRVKDKDALLSVYGIGLRFGSYLPRWDMALNLDSGVAETADTLYYFYITEDGVAKISNLCPMERPELKGLYHPFQTWRCVGQAFNNASSNLEAVISYSDLSEANYVVTHKVAANALTIWFHASPLNKLKFKSATAGSGEWQPGTLLPGTKLVIASGSTLGTTNGTSEDLWLHGILTNGKVEIAIAKFLCGKGSIVSTTAEAGNGDLDTALYSLVARSAVPVLPIAEFSNNQTAAGTWAAALEAIKLFPFGLGGKIRLKVFTASGTWTKSADLKMAIAIAIGPGGGGGGARGAADGTSVGGGGGGGGMSLKFIPGGLLGATETVTVGTGGAGGASNGAGGSNGSGPSSLGAHCSASAGNGGNGGGNGASAGGQTFCTAGGAGGTGSSGTLNIGGNAGGTGAAGGNGTGSRSAGGNGGSSFFGGGGIGGQTIAGLGNGVAGSNGNSYGSGGGGAASNNLTGAAGGNGTDGLCLVLEIFD